MTKSAIKTDRLTRSFGKTTAIENLSLDVPRGIVYGFLGPNGAGKTTTIRLLLGLIGAESGTGEVLGFDIDTAADCVREHCGVLLEHTGIYERLTVEDNLEYTGRIWRVPAYERKIRIDELLEKFELAERRKDQAGKLSEGMKQKLAISRAIFHKPRLVFLDEPTSGLDAVSASALRNDILTLALEEGVTVFLTTHNLTEAEKLCSRVGVIRKGRLIYDGSPDELRTGRGELEIEIEGSGFSETLLDRLRTSDERIKNILRKNDGIVVVTGEHDKAASIVKFLVNGGAEIESVRKGKESLEEAFLAILENKDDENGQDTVEESAAVRKEKTE